MKKWNLIEISKDNIPGFRDTSRIIIGTYDTKEEAEKELKKHKGSSQFHLGFGAGEGSIKVWYTIKEAEEDIK